MTHRFRIGEVFEIRTRRGLAYVQYTHDGQEGEQIVRVLPRLFSERPPELGPLVEQPERFYEQVFLEQLVQVADVAACGRFPLPRGARRFPTFRSTGLPDRLTGRIEHWVFNADGRTWTASVPLTAEQLEVSISGFSTIDDLVWRIESGWSPRYQREGGQQTAPASPAARYEHTLLLPSKERARAAAERLAERGLQNTSVRRVSYGKRWWRVVASESAWDAEERKTAQLLERVAQELGGEYEGCMFEDDEVDDGPTVLRHRLVFINRDDALRAHRELAGEYEARVEAEGARWTVLADRLMPKTERDEIREEDALEALAERFGGRYEGSVVNL